MSGSHARNNTKGSQGETRQYPAQEAWIQPRPAEALRRSRLRRKNGRKTQVHKLPHRQYADLILRQFRFGNRSLVPAASRLRDGGRSIVPGWRESGAVLAGSIGLLLALSQTSFET